MMNTNELVVDRGEYGLLVRNSALLAIVKNYVEKSEYISTKDIKILLEIEEKEGEEECSLEN